jgi:hypothetical protein
MVEVLKHLKPEWCGRVFGGDGGIIGNCHSTMNRLKFAIF